MTLSESASLTAEQLLVAVAERLGWRDIRLTWKGWNGRFGKTEYWKGIPNYPESRDACEEFEKLIDSLPMDARSKYLDLLALTFDWPETKNAADLRFEVQYRTVRADGTQRCRAFLAVTSEVTENRNE